MQKITTTWDGFPKEVPHDIRRDVLKILSVIHEVAFPTDELLATMAVNLYLTGVNRGIREAQEMVASTVKSFGRGR